MTWKTEQMSWMVSRLSQVLSSLVVTTVAAIDDNGELVTIEKWGEVGSDVLELYLESVGVGIGKIIQA